MLAIEGLTLSYPDRPPLLAGWSATFAPGLHWITGDEGTGKSTLLRWLAGAIDAPGRAMLREAGAERPLGPSDVWWHEPAGPDGETPAKAWLRAQSARWPHWDGNRLDAAIDALALGEHLPKPLLALSRGSRRKVAWAAAVAARAPVTLIDDPFSALDLASVRALTALLGEAGTDAARDGRVLLVAQWDPVPGLPATGECRLGQGASA